MIVEGVPALLMTDLAGYEDSLKVYMDVEQEKRDVRLSKDYDWRGVSATDLSRILRNRELDEVPVIEQSQRMANFIVGTK